MGKNITLSVAIDKAHLKKHGVKNYHVFYENVSLFHFANPSKGKWLFWSNGSQPFAEIESETVPMEQILNLTRAFAVINLAGEAVDEVELDQGDTEITVNDGAVETNEAGDNRTGLQEHVAKLAHKILPAIRQALIDAVTSFLNEYASPTDGEDGTPLPEYSGDCFSLPVYSCLSEPEHENFDRNAPGGFSFKMEPFNGYTLRLNAHVINLVKAKDGGFNVELECVDEFDVCNEGRDVDIRELDTDTLGRLCGFLAGLDDKKFRLAAEWYADTRETE